MWDFSISNLSSSIITDKMCISIISKFGIIIGCNTFYYLTQKYDLCKATIYPQFLLLFPQKTQNQLQQTSLGLFRKIMLSQYQKLSIIQTEQNEQIIRYPKVWETKTSSLDTLEKDWDGFIKTLTYLKLVNNPRHHIQFTQHPETEEKV